MGRNKLNEKDIDKLESLADWMDSRFKIPGTSIRFGFDALLGLVPGVGDTLTLISTFYLHGVARKSGLPWYVSVKMFCNAFLDWFIGLIPFLGDIFDIGWKANKKNVALIKQHVKR